MVATGLALTGLLVSYAGPLKIFGGILIIFLGLLSIRSYMVKPSEPTRLANAPETGHVVKAFSTTFVLTLSNPMTILAFVALVSGLGSGASASSNTAYWLVLGIFSGSALWWLLLVQAALLARSKMTTSIMRILDLLSGIVLITWGAWIAASAIQILL
jgi:threonine/homoserine/homoserine lactone efflux protein